MGFLLQPLLQRPYVLRNISFLLQPSFDKSDFFFLRKMHTTFSQLSQRRPPFLVEQHLRQSDQPLTAKLVVQKVEARRKV